MTPGRLTGGSNEYLGSSNELMGSTSDLWGFSSDLKAYFWAADPERTISYRTRAKFRPSIQRPKAASVRSKLASGMLKPASGRL